MGPKRKVVSWKVLEERQLTPPGRGPGFGNRRVVTFLLKLDDGHTVERTLHFRGGQSAIPDESVYCELCGIGMQPPASFGTRVQAVEGKIPRKPNPAYHAMLERQRIDLQQASVKRGATRIKSLYDAAQDALESKLRHTIGRGRGETFTAHSQRLLLAQVRQGQQVLANQMVGQLGDLTKQAQVDSLKGLSSSLTKMEKEFNGVDVTLPLDEASTFWGIVDGRQASIMQQMKPTVARLGSRIVGEVERGLAMSLVTGENIDEAIDRTRQITGEQWWQAERIVRTEQAFAFNAAHADGIAAIADEVDDMYMRWVEHVSDTGVPLDNRVGDDSIAMHGQVTRPGGLFTMPEDPDVSDSLIGESWQFPPNRPNDRAVVVAWRPSWGGMAWIYDGGAKRYLSR